MRYEIAAVWGVFSLISLTSTGRAAPVDFAKEIAPILSSRCVHCHNERQKKGQLSLETAKSARRGGESGPAFVPGKPSESHLLDMISGKEPDMPKNDTPLNKKQIQRITQWIREGARWPAGLRLQNRFRPSRKWWSLTQLKKPPVPRLPVQLGRRAITPIDSFILSRLQREQMTLSAAASKRTLIRRLSFDLRGLPPTPEEMAEFLRDVRPFAYEELVERFLASPQYGERWGRHWLDVVHYGDTHGYDKDKVRPNAWPYRDYIIRAFNSDKPYWRFVTEQLAGDIRFPESPDGIVATGFIAAGPWDFVGHVELRESLVDKQITRLLDRDDMVATTMNTFVSLTAQCARCHNHKFDPITQEDYYSLQAVFAGVERANRPYFADTAAAGNRHRLVRRQQDLVRRTRVIRATQQRLLTPEIRKLDAQIQRIRQSVAQTASLPVTRKQDRLGYHSQIMKRQDRTKWVQIDLGKVQPIDQIVLVGAHVKHAGHPGPGFGFPVRFRVDVAEQASFENKTCVADQTSADFSNPGDRPLVLPTPRGLRGRFIRVTATRLWKRSNDFIFALSEMLAFSNTKNIARNARVTALDSIERVAWAKKNLVDGQMGRTSWEDLAAGKPQSRTNGFHSAIVADPDHDKWVQVDLGSSLPLTEIRLRPARPTDFRDAPGFGFPLRYKVLVSNDSTFQRSVTVLDRSSRDFPNPGVKPVSVKIKGRKTARYVRVIAHKLWKRSNDYTFALGELQVFSAGLNVARNSVVTARDSIEAGLWSARHLVDGYDSRQLVDSPFDLLMRFQGPADGRLQQLEQRRQQLFAKVVDPRLATELTKAERELVKVNAELAALGQPGMVYAAASAFKRQGNFVPPPNGRPRLIHVLRRGDIKQPLKLVRAGTVSCLPSLPHRFGNTHTLDGPRRVAMAKWIASRKNPLTWRSIANRVWHYHFGRGIVDTPNDFGRMGKKPTHPLLLDWLAVELRDHPYQSLKHLHRLIVTSAVYRQSSRHHAQFAAKDAANRLYWRMNRRRLDAESIRDSVLQMGNRLNLKMFGPGFRPFGFKDDHSPQYRYTEHDPNDVKTQRRSIYRFIVRSVPDPFMETLDCADPSLAVEKRNETITPLQALALLNNRFMVVMAGHFAADVQRQAREPGKQIITAVNKALGRSPTKSEFAALLKYRNEHGLANTCRLLLNLNEFVFVD